MTIACATIKTRAVPSHVPLLPPSPSVSRMLVGFPHHRFIGSKPLGHGARAVHVTISGDHDVRLEQEGRIAQVTTISGEQKSAFKDNTRVTSMTSRPRTVRFPWALRATPLPPSPVFHHHHAIETGPSSRSPIQHESMNSIRLDRQPSGVIVLSSCVLWLTHFSARLLWLALRQRFFTPAAILGRARPYLSDYSTL